MPRAFPSVFEAAVQAVVRDRLEGVVETHTDPLGKTGDGTKEMQTWTGGQFQAFLEAGAGDQRRFALEAHDRPLFSMR